MRSLNVFSSRAAQQEDDCRRLRAMSDYWPAPRSHLRALHSYGAVEAGQVFLFLRLLELKWGGLRDASRTEAYPPAVIVHFLLPMYDERRGG